MVDDKNNRCGPVLGNEVGNFIHVLQTNDFLDLLGVIAPSEQQALLDVSCGILQLYTAVWDIHHPISIRCKEACKCCKEVRFTIAHQAIYPKVGVSKTLCHRAERINKTTKQFSAHVVIIPFIIADHKSLRNFSSHKRERQSQGEVWRRELKLGIIEILEFFLKKLNDPMALLRTELCCMAKLWDLLLGSFHLSRKLFLPLSVTFLSIGCISTAFLNMHALGSLCTG